MTNIITLHHGLSLRTKLPIASATLLLGLFGAACGSIFDYRAAPDLSDAQEDAICQIANNIFFDPLDIFFDAPDSPDPLPSAVSVKHNPVAPPASLVTSLAMSLEVAPLGKYAQVYTPPTMENQSSAEPPSLDVESPVAATEAIASATITDAPMTSAPVELTPIITVDVVDAAPQSSVVKKQPRADTVSLLGPLRVDGRLFTIDTFDRIVAEPPVVPAVILSFPKEFTPPPTLPEHLTALKPIPREKVSAPPRVSAPQTVNVPATSSLVPLTQLAQKSATPNGSDSFVPIRHLPLRSAGE